MKQIFHLRIALLFALHVYSLISAPLIPALVKMHEFFSAYSPNLNKNWCGFAIMGAPSLVTALLGIPVGIWLAKTSLTKAIKYSMILIAFYAVALASTNNIWIFIAIRMILGINVCVVMVGSMRFIDKHCEPSEQIFMFSACHAIIDLCSALYAITGDYLTKINWKFTLLLYVIPAILAPYVSKYLSKQENNKLNFIKTEPTFTDIRQGRIFSLIISVMVVLVISISTFATTISIPLAIAERNIALSPGYMVFIFMISGSIFSLIQAKLFKRWPPIITCSLGFVIGAISHELLLYGYTAVNIAAIKIGYGIFGLAGALIFPYVSINVCNFSISKHHSTWIGAVTAIISISGALSSYFNNFAQKYLHLKYITIASLYVPTYLVMAACCYVVYLLNKKIWNTRPI